MGGLQKQQIQQLPVAIKLSEIESMHAPTISHLIKILGFLIKTIDAKKTVLLLKTQESVC